jgi:class 3 adenylate cyclase
MEGRKPCLHGHPLPSWCAIAYLVTILAWERVISGGILSGVRGDLPNARTTPASRPAPPRTAETRPKKLLFATREAPPLASKRVERHLPAVLTADVAGYSRLMGSDEEGTPARLIARRRALIDPKIAEHRGQILKTTGDGMLVEFVGVVAPFAPC